MRIKGGDEKGEGGNAYRCDGGYLRQGCFAPLENVIRFQPDSRFWGSGSEMPCFAERGSGSSIQSFDTKVYTDV